MKLLLFIIIIPTIKSLVIPPPSCANCKFYKPHSYEDFETKSFARCTYYGVDKYVDVVRSDDSLCGITGKNFVKEKYIGIKKLKEYISSNKFEIFALLFVIDHIYILFKEAFGRLR